MAVVSIAVDRFELYRRRRSEVHLSRRAALPRLAREPKVLDRKRAQELLLMCDAKSRRTNAAAARRLRLSEQAISSRMSPHLVSRQPQAILL
ncbi:hypothetical protein ACQR1W_02700 [Bradyrhizobium sp. HKCCYLS1011]|uniref:hypothetical protein n=1 Tax=Bradyrhizobium sp. HKCCYLS1011 TaxID=3420733 RepID=UPI003EBE1736